uniref:Uncharacterized protein n=1 Tax=viral metagenome TaxID=1070528 RepID=A0A6C0LLY5_9ZZZZ
MRYILEDFTPIRYVEENNAKYDSECHEFSTLLSKCSLDEQKEFTDNVKWVYFHIKYNQYDAGNIVSICIKRTYSEKPWSENVRAAHCSLEKTIEKWNRDIKRYTAQVFLKCQEVCDDVVILIINNTDFYEFTSLLKMLGANEFAFEKLRMAVRTPILRPIINIPRRVNMFIPIALPPPLPKRSSKAKKKK